MQRRIRCLMVGTVLAFAGAAGCDAPTPPTYEHVTASAAKVVSAKASALARSKLGVTRWHATTEPGTNGAVTIDGQDGAGRVTFLTTAQIDKRKGTLRVETIFPERGELVWDLAKQRVVTNTIPASASGYLAAIYRDFPAAHPRGGNEAYSILSGSIQVGVGVVKAVGGIGIAAVGETMGATTVIGGIPGLFLDVAGKAIAKDGIKDIINGAGEIITSATAATPAPATPSADPSAPSDPNATPSDPNATPSDPNTTPTDPNTTPTDPSADPTDPSADPTDPSVDAVPDPDPTPSTGADVQSLPAANDGGDLDNVQASSDTGGDLGGDVGEAFAAGLCRRVAVSRTTGIRACTHY
jgi:hypothetical protein